MSERYAVHAIPIVETKGWLGRSVSVRSPAKKKTYNLELNRNNAEVEDLHCRPKHEIGLEGWQVNIPELLGQCPSATTLGDCHVAEETRET